MEERIILSMLMDYYGGLLTDKQRDIMNLYFNDDLSLAEISQLTKTSRQAIHDIIKRCQKQLYEYENVLGLLNKNSELLKIKQTINEMLNTFIEYDDFDKEKTIEFVIKLKNYINENL